MLDYCLWYAYNRGIIKERIAIMEDTDSFDLGRWLEYQQNIRIDLLDYEDD